MRPLGGRALRRDHLLWEVLADIRNALERMAAADERRNELLEADAAVRDAKWAESERRQDERLAIIAALPEPDGD